MSISKVLNQYIYGFTYIKCFHTMNIYQFLYNGIIDDKKQNFPRHRVFDPFFSYIGVIFLSFIFIRYKKDENLNKILIPVSEGGSVHHSNLYLTLIYTKNKNYLKDKKGFFFDKEKQFIELPNDDKVNNSSICVIIDSECNIHFLTKNKKNINVYKFNK